MNLQQLYEECADYVCGKSNKLAKDILEDAIVVFDKENLFQNHSERYKVVLNLWDSDSLDDYVKKCGIEVEELCGDLADYLADESSFEDCENKTPVQIMRMYNELKQSIRLYFSRMLMDHDENNRLDCFYPIFRNQDYFGLGELEKPFINQMYQMNDGTIWLHIDGMLDTWNELDDFEIEDIIEFIENIENEKTIKL